MAPGRFRYSGYLRPINYLYDIGVIGLLSLQFDLSPEQTGLFVLFHIIAWGILSIKSGFYEVFRFTKVVRVLSLLIIQAVIFTLIVFFYFYVFVNQNYETYKLFIYVGEIFSLITLYKLGVYLLLKKYRRFTGSNFRKVVIIGSSSTAKQLKEFVVSTPEYGYELKAHFKLDVNQDNSSLKDIKDYIIHYKIDEIYCSVSSLKNQTINELIDFADNNLIIIKFIPDNKDLYAKQLKVDYYGYLPLLSLRRIPVDDAINKFIKRTFDLIMSTLVIIGLLSWLTPILGLLIRLESKGPIFFKQKRNGLDYKEFYCYKFRSMRPNSAKENEWVKPNDKRVTSIGKFIRKTSIDELPQFFNVFLGEMSVVGPRPHPVTHTQMFVGRIDKFMVRHFVKPGITGLAQVSGFRGEVETDYDIISRVKYDIFYLENWSLLLDIKIIIQTIFKAVEGDKKAY
jgi:putative colanic acid biosynthesis UDP-glucose lipid carrier transferase